jgi:septal ring factor EnvC (AmiA/AmiB activator)
MSDPSNRDHNGSDLARSRWVPLWIFAVILIAIGGAVFLGNVTALQQTVTRAADQISDLQRQLSAEQGERKLLSEQIGALAKRVDSLERARTETTEATKKRGLPR